MKVVCINDLNRPNEIPLEKWIKKGQEYTPVKFSNMSLQGNQLGIQLEEIDLEDCYPFTYFAANRFIITEPDEEIEKEEELIEELELA